MPSVGILMEEEQQIIPCVETEGFAWVPQPKATGISLRGGNLSITLSFFGSFLLLMLLWNKMDNKQIRNAAFLHIFFKVPNSFTVS